MTPQQNEERDAVVACWDCKHLGFPRFLALFETLQPCNRPCGQTFSPVFGTIPKTPKDDCHRERRRTLWDKICGVERCGPEGKFFERKEPRGDHREGKQ